MTLVVPSGLQVGHVATVVAIPKPTSSEAARIARPLNAPKDTMNATMERAQDAWAQMQEIRGKVESSGWTDPLRKRWDAQEAIYSDCERELGIGRFSNSSGTMPAGATSDLMGPNAPGPHAPGAGIRNSVGSATFGRSLARDQRFGDLPGFSRKDPDPAEADAFWRDAIDMATNSRAASTLTGPAGGYTTPEIVFSSIWDRARPATVAHQAGVNFVPMDSGPGDQFVLPTLVSEPTPQYRQENAEMTEGDFVLGLNRLIPRSLDVVCRVSEELIQDSAVGDLSVFIRDTLAKSFAEKIDRGVFTGTGVGVEPLGIVNATSISYAYSSNSLSYANLITDVGTLRDANVEPTATVYAPRSARQLIAIGSDGHYVENPPYIANVPRLETGCLDTNLTSGSATNESWVITADYTQVFLAVRAGLTIRPLLERYATSRQIAFVAGCRWDLAVMRPSAVVARMAGIL